LHILVLTADCLPLQTATCLSFARQNLPSLVVIYFTFKMQAYRKTQSRALSLKHFPPEVCWKWMFAVKLMTQTTWRTNVRKLTFLMAAAGALFLSSALMLPRAASAAVKCQYYADSSNAYPDDKYISGQATTHSQVCGDNGVLPPQSRYDAFNTAIRTKLPPFAASAMKQRNNLFFFFNTRAEAVSYFQTSTKYKASPVYANNMSTGRCGATAYASGVGITVSAAWDTCIIGTNTTFSNPALDRTGLHESGHSFAIAVGQLRSSHVQPDTAPGFTTTLDRDINGQNPVDLKYVVGLTPSNWSSYTQAQKNTYICGMFGATAPSALEIDFQATAGAVCSGTTPKGAFATMTPTQIAITKKKMPPYFSGDSKEIWAQAFADYALNSWACPESS
jgi:hypothetical protein